MSESDKKPIGPPASEENILQPQGEEILRDILNVLPLPISWADSRGKIRFWSQKAVEMFGYSGGEVPTVQDWFLKAYPNPEYRAEVVDRWNRSVANAKQTGGEILGNELRVACKNGFIRTVDILGTFVGDRMLVIFRDMTEQKQALEALRESEASLERAQSLAHVGNWDLNPATGMGKWSREMFRLFGLDPAQGVPQLKDFLEMVHPEDRALLRATHQKAYDTGGRHVVSYRTDPARGQVRHFTTIIEAVKEPSGRIDRLIGAVQDNTERIESIDRIREQAALLHETHDAVLVYDLEQGVQFMNPAAEELIGMRSAEARGNNLLQVLRPRSELSLRAALQEVVSQGSWTGELELQTSSGRERDLDSRWTMLENAEGKPRSILITCNDITEKKRLEAQYLRAQRLESVGTLASGVAHDLNNILSPIMMGIEMLKTAIHDADTLSVLATMKESAQRGRDTIKQLLTFARGTEFQKGPIQPRHLLKELDRLLQRTFPKNIRIYTEFAEQPSTVLADPSQMHQVLMNLCVNARDAMPEGGVLFVTLENRILDESSLNIHPKARPIPYVVFKVSDSGAGIPEEILDRIFDPFFTTKPQGKGTGLGLATVLGIVEGHGGFVLVDSKPGHGTTFQIFIPASAPLQHPGAAPEDSILPRGHGELVLIVDDEPAILRTAENFLRRNGYATLTASGASQALSLFEKHREEIHAVLTDIMMPAGDGRQLISMLREMNYRLPVIAMSGLATREAQQETIDRGAAAFLDKPFNAEQLLTALNEALSRKHR